MKNLIGKSVIVRAHMSGVHFGTLESVDGEVIKLSNARRLWRWWAKDGVSLSAVALNGLADRSEVVICGALPQILINGWCEIIPVGGEIADQIRDFRPSK